MINKVAVMFKSIANNLLVRPLNFVKFYNFSTVSSSAAVAAEQTTVASVAPVVIQTTKENIAQSPLKMRVLVMLVRL